MTIDDIVELLSDTVAEIEQLRADAKRYRRLGWLIEFSHWSVRRDYGLSPHIASKDGLDTMLDDPDVIA